MRRTHFLIFPRMFRVALALISSCVWAACMGMLLAEPQLEVEPPSALLSDPVSIRVSGVEKGAKVVVRASVRDEFEREWKSQAVFEADDKGQVDTAKMEPVSGSYRGVDPFGLFWSMDLPKDAAQRTFFYHPSDKPLVTRIEVQVGEEQILEDTLERRVVAEGVVREEIRTPEIVGTLYRPGGDDKPRPAVIVLGGSEGGAPEDSYIAQFANAGFVTLGLAYFSHEGLRNNLSRIPVEYFLGAIEYLKGHEAVDAEHIGIVGTSIGGMAALLVAANSADIKAVVSFQGGGAIFQTLDPDPMDREPAQSPFSLGGVPLNFIPVTAPPLTAESLSTAYFLRVFLGSLFAATDRVIAAAEIPVEQISGPVLLLAGQDDRLLGSATLSEIAYGRLVRRRFAYPYELKCYNGVGHTLGVGGLPGFPTHCTAQLVSELNIAYPYGGNPRDNAHARMDSWRRALDFLSEHLGVEKEEPKEPESGAASRGREKKSPDQKPPR